MLRAFTSCVIRNWNDEDANEITRKIVANIWNVRIFSLLFCHLHYGRFISILLSTLWRKNVNISLVWPCSFLAYFFSHVCCAILIQNVERRKNANFFIIIFWLKYQEEFFFSLRQSMEIGLIIWLKMKTNYPEYLCMTMQMRPIFICKESFYSLVHWNLHLQSKCLDCLDCLVRSFIFAQPTFMDTLYQSSWLLKQQLNALNAIHG